MNIVVCVKQVPASDQVRVDPETGNLLRQGTESVINPYDTHAIEEAVRIRERLGAGRVTVLSMGPPQAEAALREAVSLGADAAVLLSSRAFAGADTYATSLTLAAAVRKLGPDLVLAGKNAIDGDTGQVGPGLACHLDWPQACYVSKVREIEPGRAVLECLMDTGKEVLEVDLPAVLTVVKEINEPRLASLKGKMRAKKAAIPVWDENELGLSPEDVGMAGSPTAVSHMFNPPSREGGEVLRPESPAAAARCVAARIKELQS